MNYYKITSILGEILFKGNPKGRVALIRDIRFTTGFDVEWEEVTEEEHNQLLELNPPRKDLDPQVIQEAIEEINEASKPSISVSDLYWESTRRILFELVELGSLAEGNKHHKRLLNEAEELVKAIQETEEL